MRFKIGKSKLLTFIKPSFGYSKLLFNRKYKKLAFNLYPENFGRALVITMFMTEFSKLLTPKTKMTVAVVGGYKLEPEIQALELLGIETDITVFGIDNNTTYFNLNEATDSQISLYGDFDLVLCSQVWEHIWNHEVGQINLMKLTKKGGYLWLACPTSNRPHSSPSYYCAGFTAEYLVNNLSRIGWTVYSSGQLGTPRNYRATHNLPAWLSVSGHRFPPIGAFSQRSLIPRFLYSLRFLFTNISLLLSSSRVTNDINCATETWVLAIRH